MNTIKTNKEGEIYIKTWLNNCAVLGIETRNNNNWQYVIIKRADIISVVALPHYNTDAFPCYFGNLEYFATIAAAEKALFSPRYNGGNLIDPKWYIDGVQLDTYLSEKRRIMAKYMV